MARGICAMEYSLRSFFRRYFKDYRRRNPCQHHMSGRRANLIDIETALKTQKEGGEAHEKMSRLRKIYFG